MTPTPATRRSNVAAFGLSALMLAAGVAHFVVPDRYAAIVPESLGSARAWVYGSGVAELVGAALVAHPRTRRVGGWFVAVLLVAVFPANVKMALDGGAPGESGMLGNATAAWLRLPLQVPLVLWALHVARVAKTAEAGALTSATHSR
ncbi:MAG TPA: hypothetical protein VNB24_02745 [Acidimicrobiales bacterium]|nr:hypothetical protein [Acidimicrobiales bacterium]